MKPKHKRNFEQEHPPIFEHEKCSCPFCQGGLNIHNVRSNEKLHLKAGDKDNILKAGVLTILTLVIIAIILRNFNNDLSIGFILGMIVILLVLVLSKQKN